MSTHRVDGQIAAIPEFDVASLKLNRASDRPQAQFKASPGAGRLVISGMPVVSVIQRAYGLQNYELVHDDNSFLNQRIDIEAKTNRPVASSVEMQRMLQRLL